MKVKKSQPDKRWTLAWFGVQRKVVVVLWDIDLTNVYNAGAERDTNLVYNAVEKCATNLVYNAREEYDTNLVYNAGAEYVLQT